ncbi:7TMR-DISM extracellular 2 [Pseudomonas benzenivorans]|nr:7TM-DISM domain-containing protein [Pseudomonas benzenivorans]SDG56721.1 7TMR-DISM extracellular 2 [Pseudomonas benzenivorans]
MQRQTLAILLLLSLFSGLSFASPVLLSTPSSGSVLNGQIELLEDVGGQLSIADMADPAVQGRFQPAAGRTSVGQSSNPWWIKLSLQRASGAPAQWWLEVGAVTLLDLQIFLPDAQGGWQTRQVGERVGFAEGRDHDYRRAVFSLPPLS